MPREGPVIVTLRELGSGLFDELQNIIEWFERGFCALTLGKSCGEHLNWLDLTLGQAIFTVLIVGFAVLGSLDER